MVINWVPRKGGQAYVLLGEKVNRSGLEGDVLEVQTEPDSPSTGRAVEGVEDWLRGRWSHFSCFGVAVEKGERCGKKKKGGRWWQIVMLFWSEGECGQGVCVFVWEREKEDE